MKHQVDYCVIGAGSAGVRFARTAAALGARVAIVERQYWGGTCVNMGCIPKKLFVYASEYSHHFSESKNFGWNSHAEPFSPIESWARLRKNVFTEITRLNQIYKNLLDKSGVIWFQADAKLFDANRVILNEGEAEIIATNIIIATGAKPVKPDFPGAEHVIVSDDIFILNELPRSIAILGGGYIAAEFAAILHGLGVETHLIYRGKCFLRGFEEELTQFLADSYRKSGIHLHFETEIQSVATKGAHFQVNTSRGEITVETVFAALGRKPNSDSFGLQQLGVALNENQTVMVNSQFQTSVSSIYAVGDVIGGAQLTPVALAQAMALAKHLVKGEPLVLPYSNIPSAIFTQPTFATVGLTEQQAINQQIPVDIYSSEFKPLKHTVSGSHQRAFLKLLVNTETQKVVGVHMVGDHADEIIQGLAVAMTAGATKSDFDTTLGIHPTAAEEFVTMREVKRHSG